MFKRLAQQTALLTIILLFLPFVSLETSAQVTIGSSVKPNEGTILDLKQHAPTSDNVTSSIGLALPRVELTDLKNLYPMLEESPGSGIPASNYQGASKAEEDLKHAGLLIYNLDQCHGIAGGVYIWSGAKWIPLSENIVRGAASGVLVNGVNDKTSDEVMIHIPSGVDLRTFTPQQILEIGWNPSSIGYLDLSWRFNTIGGGLDFISNPVSGWTRPGGVNPTIYTYEINDMSGLPDINGSNPWQSRETAVKFEAYDPDECGVKINKVLHLNQTNYALRFIQNDPMVSDFNLLLKDEDGYNTSYLRPRSNAKWNMSYTAKDSGILTSHNIPSEGGAENTQGGFSTEEFLMEKVPGVDASDNNKYKIAGTAIFSDTTSFPNNRFPPITVSIVKCQGTPYTDGVYKAANPTETTSGSSAWNGKVVLHPAKTGVYDEFFSAEFGSAGRWMITNLAATSYDSGEVNNPIALHDGDTVTIARKYAYPGNTDKANNERLSWNKTAKWYLQQGIMYNWYAAANITNLSDLYMYGSQEQTVPGLDNAPQIDEVEQLTGAIYKGTPPKAYVQGICPDGWHLPSDREWNRLEREIYNNPSKYTIYTSEQIAKFSPNSWQESYEIFTGPRGSTSNDNAIGHGGSMKETCSVDDKDWLWMNTSKGYSKPIAQGGFNIINVGQIRGDKINHYGYSGIFWSSSTIDQGRSVMIRHSDFQTSVVHRYPQPSENLFSVRCVKN